MCGRSSAGRSAKGRSGSGGGRLEQVGGFYAAPGFCQEYLHFFIASDLTPSALPADEDESIDVVPVPLADIPSLIERAEVRDAKSVAGLWWTLRRLGR